MTAGDGGAGRPRLPAPHAQSVAELLVGPVAEHPDREALVDAHRRLTYREVDEEANRAARALVALGVGAGDRVAVSLPNVAEIVTLFLGAMRVGAVWVGVNRALAPPEKQHQVADSGASVFVGDGAALESLAGARAEHDAGAASAGGDLRRVAVVPGGRGGEWAALLEEAGGEPPGVAVDPHAPAAIAYTSGTTGRPKGVVHSQHNILVPAAVIADTRLRGRPERAGVCLPLTILNVVVLGPVLSFTGRGCCVCMDRADAVGIAGWVRRERLEHLSAAPATVHDLVSRPDIDPADLASLTRLGVGGAGCPEWLRGAYEERFGHRFTTGYGLTEAPTAVTQETETVAHVPGASGKPMPHVDVEIRAEDDRAFPAGSVGEICVAPARSGEWAGVWTPMLGYWNRPAETAVALRGGVLHTGDRGRLDAAGYLHVEDRRSDVILRGGANVYPAEVEQVLLSHPAVADCVVLGRPDERLGEEVVAAVERRPGESVSPDELRAHCAANLARYKVPVAVVAVERLPRNAMGKVPREALRSLFDAAGAGWRRPAPLGDLE